MYRLQLGYSRQSLHRSRNQRLQIRADLQRALLLRPVLKFLLGQPRLCPRLDHWRRRLAEDVTLSFRWLWQ